MHKLTDKQYEEYQRLCYSRDHGRLLTPDGLNMMALPESFLHSYTHCNSIDENENSLL